MDLVMASQISLWRVKEAAISMPANGPVFVGGHEVLTDPAEVARHLDLDKVIGLDSETSGYNPWRDRLAILQLFGEETGTAGLIRCTDGRIPEPIKDLLQSGKLLIAHNGVGFDIPFLHQAGIDVSKASWYDTLVGEAALASAHRQAISKSLKESVRRQLGLPIDKDIEHGRWGKELTERQIQYAMTDVIHLPALRRAQLERAEEADILRGLNMETELLLPTAWMMINGLPLSITKMIEYLNELRAEARATEPEYREAFGNLTANQYVALRKAFQDKGIDVDSTAKDVLQDLIELGGEAGHLASLVLGLRQATHDIRMYDDAWISQYVGSDGRIHPQFWQCGTDTTRYSSSAPNGQQFPRKMRKVFGWVDGYKIVAVDYSQIEIRIIAKLAKDEALLALLETDDVHTAIGAAVFGIPESEVAPEQRRLAKAISFTILFGGGTAKLYEYARRGGGKLLLQEAQGIVDEFFARFKGLANLRQRAYDVARTQNDVPVRLPSGLKRVLSGGQLKPTTLLNTAVQGTAAVGIKYGILEAHRRGLVRGYIGLQVHDELVATVPTAEASEYAAELKDAMLLGMNKAIQCNPRAVVKIDDCWLK